MYRLMWHEQKCFTNFWERLCVKRNVFSFLLKEAREVAVVTLVGRLTDNTTITTILISLAQY